MEDQKVKASASLIFPILYVAGLIGFLFIIGRFIKSKTQLSKQEQAGYFPINRAKYEYLELSEQYSLEDPTGKKVLVAALIKRALEDISRLFRLREEKPPLQQMVREGLIGESLWEKMIEAEQEMEAETQDLVEEANLIKPGWSNSFLQEMSQLYQMKLARNDGAAENNEQPKEVDEEAERQRLAKELIEEEEREKEAKKNKK